MHRVLPLPSLRPAWALAMAAAAALLFTALVADLELGGPVTRADVPISHWFALHAHAAATQLMLAASAFHATVPLCVFSVALAAALLVLRQAAWVPLLLAVVPGGLALNAIVKLGFHRARPVFEHPLVALSTFSFPSGHAAGATVWWGFLLALWFAREPRTARRVVGGLVAAAVVLLTMVSRVYLGAHYPSDVLAGFAEGTLWLMLCLAVAGALARRRGAEGGAPA